MIARKEWFERRKYGGWGVEPKNWKGWVYLGAILLPFAAFHSFPFWTDQTRIIVSLVWVAFLFIDLIPVMINLKRDEREHRIEAISERNAAWFMSLVLVIGVLYELLTSALNESISVNIFMAVALLGGAAVKTISNIKLEREKL